MKIKMNGSGSVCINGKRYVGGNIQITDDGIVIDGKIQDEIFSGEVNITIYGDVDRIENSRGCVCANNVNSINTISGDVECGNVSGSVKTVSGDVCCGAISGSVNTVSGDISHFEFNNRSNI